jgi:hypothetical protein
VAPRGEVKRVRVAGLGEPGGGGATWPGGRRAAGGSARPGARQGRGERAERVERKREKNLIEFKFESSSKFSNNTRNFFEYERCSKIQILPPLFQACFHLRLKSKVNLKSRRTYVISRFEFEFKISSTIVWKLENI